MAFQRCGFPLGKMGPPSKPSFPHSKVLGLVPSPPSVLSNGLPPLLLLLLRVIVGGVLIVVLIIITITRCWEQNCPQEQNRSHMVPVYTDRVSWGGRPYVRDRSKTVDRRMCHAGEGRVTPSRGTQMRRLVLIRKVISGFPGEGMIALRAKESEALIHYKITQKIQEDTKNH